ncbi:unnamed protein product [Arabidopsis halleri]
MAFYKYFYYVNYFLTIFLFIQNILISKVFFQVKKLLFCKSFFLF